ncbi:pentapeptide repeat-containing protein, partial [Candidatus Palauibacter sp.]|uniref:pentapeptide repeat-containing protein n=1 Tax=Candidatus Palauibacter sp. TaxID=3101350 RepID=UPI003B5B4FBC
MPPPASPPARKAVYRRRSDGAYVLPARPGAQRMTTSEARQRIARGESLSGCNLRGADLSGMRLEGIDFSDAL